MHGLTLLGPTYLEMHGKTNPKESLNLQQKYRFSKKDFFGERFQLLSEGVSRMETLRFWEDFRLAPSKTRKDAPAYPQGQIQSLGSSPRALEDPEDQKHIEHGTVFRLF
jgi:hypothetical protein